MPTFEVAESQSNCTVPSFARATTVDIGVILGGGIRRYHADMMLVSERLASEQAIDGAIDRLLDELEQVRSKAKALLETLKR